MNMEFKRALAQRIAGGVDITTLPADVQEMFEIGENGVTIKDDVTPVVEVTPTPTIEERLEAVEEATEEVITALNEKGIVP